MEKGGNILDRILEFTKNSEFDAARKNNNTMVFKRRVFDVFLKGL